MEKTIWKTENENKIEKRIEFGKIDVNGCGRLINRVTINFSIEYKNGNKTEPVFSASGDVWNSKNTDIVLGGQCLDELNEYPLLKSNKTFQKILKFWHQYHLNDLNAGTPEQMKCINEHKAEINEEDGFYTKELNLLKKYGLDVVELNGKPYKYGTAWLYRPIPENDLNEILELLRAE
jgi:hypothetical protein